MIYDHILIRYGELALKGKNRSFFIQLLKRNIKGKLKDFPNVKIRDQHDFMYIILNGEDHEAIIERLKHIFGIHSLSLALKVDNDVEAIKEACLKVLNKGHGETFKISAKRPNKNFPIQSQEMNHILGGHLLKNSTGWEVDVHNPDVNIRVNIRHDATYITEKNIEGKGGFPVGSTGKTLLMLSGGIDSPVAGYLAMKRGVELEAIHFNSSPYTSERAKQKEEN